MSKYSPLISEFSSAEEEAAYEAWLKQKVEASLADPRPSIPHDEVIAEIDTMLEAKKAKQAAESN
ncbi:type II toxin-antitoxin system RelB family antitoxin [Erythrobacter sp. EC-HK427]|uniref:type II toxin-antitoxin system RelB family antitoxin n=1 Tax=Erythrobacter sp. EC-HK427 TaxID=2038396 RepID=UPI00125F4869|nr:stability determinant [Erythrobacter sp. EC-HK427]